MSKPRSRTVTRSRKPTRRVNGQTMYSATVRYAVGIDEVAWAAAQEYVLEAREPRANTARSVLWKRVEDRLRLRGPLGCDAWDDINAEQTDEAYAIARKYYPELKEANHD